MSKFCITFAGAVGSSKSPIASYLSYKLDLPILNNDIIRTEVLEDLGMLDQKEYLHRRDTRAADVLNRGISFIYDASIDREWETLRKWLTGADYHFFIISMDLSRDFLKSLYELKHYTESLERLDTLVAEHQRFLDTYGDLAGLHITDSTFTNRLALAYEASVNFISSL